MNDENELLEPLATEAGQQAIVRAIRDISSLEYAVRAEQAASTASAKAGEASQSAIEASEAEDKAKDWATKTDTYVEQETITIPPEQEGEEPTTETINLYSARYYAALAQDIYNNMSFDSVPTENSNALLSSGTVYSALDLKADKSNTYTKTEVDTALSNVQSTLTFDNVPTANSDNPVKSSGIKTALDGKQDTLTFDITPTANSTNPVTSGGVYTALQNVNIDIDDEITEDSDNPVTSAAIYEALQNIVPSGGGGGAGNASGVVEDTLFESSTGVNTGTINLSGNISDYDLIAFQVWTGQETYACGNPIIQTSTLLEFKDKGGTYRVGADRAGLGVVCINVISDNQFNLIEYTNNAKIYKITGIKFSKNLSEQMYSNVLYQNSSGIGNGTTITLSDSYKNYDFLEAYCKDDAWRKQVTTYSTPNELGTTGLMYVYNGGNKWVALQLTSSDTQLSVDASNSSKLYKIVGYKLAKGGYSGIVSDARMTVKSGTLTTTSAIADGGQASYSISFDSPMPDTNYNVIVEVLGGASGASRVYQLANNKTVNGFDIVIWGRGQRLESGLELDWVAIRPNSYTREGMVEDVLFSNTSGVSSGTINLSGNISDYDLISIEIGNDQGVHNTSIFQSSFLLDRLGMTSNTYDGIVVIRYHESRVNLYVATDSSFSFDAAYTSKIYKITGIKFGRYVSGVSIDTTVTQNSSNVITSGAVYDALQNIPSGGGSGGSITIDSAPTENSQNAVSSGGVYDAIKYGLPVEFEDLVPSDAKVESAGTIIYKEWSRNYYKENNGVAAGALAIVNGSRHAVLVSDVESAVISYSSYDTSVKSTASSITVNGKTYYYSATPYGWSGSDLGTVSNLNVKDLSTTSFPNNQSLAEYIIQNILTEDKLLSDYNITDAYTKTEVDTLLQNAGGSSITVDSTITQGGTNPVESGAIYTALDNKADKSTTYTKTEVDTALGSKQGTLTFDTTPTADSTNPVTSGGVYTALASKGDVTTDTAQNITGTKTFVGSKKVAFKQSMTNDKLGFTLYGNTGTERGYLEFNPTNTVDGVTGLMTIGNYATSAAGLTQVGFRRYSNISGASGAYNLLMPMVADARTPFSLTTTYQNFYLPLGFTDGTTTVKTAKSGLVDLSPLLASLESRIAALEGN